MYALRERYEERGVEAPLRSYVRSKSKNDISSVLIESVSRVLRGALARARGSGDLDRSKRNLWLVREHVVPRTIKGARLLLTGISTCQHASSRGRSIRRFVHQYSYLTRDHFAWTSTRGLVAHNNAHNSSGFHVRGIYFHRRDAPSRQLKLTTVMQAMIKPTNL